jgi:hypothetical protein
MFDNELFKLMCAIYMVLIGIIGWGVIELLRLIARAFF